MQSCPRAMAPFCKPTHRRHSLSISAIEAEVIDYAPEYVTRSHKVCFVGDEMYKRNPLVKLAYLLITGPSRYKRNLMFHSFLDKYIHFTPRQYHTYDDLCATPPVADRYVCGSDQIWNINFPNGWDKSYYLGFAKNKPKYSLAASLALKKESLPSDYLSFIKEQLKDFTAITVREDIAVDIIQPQVEQKVQHVLDPVFLLDSKDWDKLESKAESTVRKEGYILIMPMGDGANVFDVARQLKSHYNIPVYSISFSKRKIDGIDKTFNACSPSMFLRLIKNAKVMVTNSFHGTAFSIIYKRNFWACSIPGTSSRIESLLRSFGLENRLVLGELEQKKIHEKIDYEVVEDKQVIDTRRIVESFTE